jgi:hypothetical protein
MLWHTGVGSRGVGCAFLCVQSRGQGFDLTLQSNQSTAGLLLVLSSWRSRDTGKPISMMQRARIVLGQKPVHCVVPLRIA